MTKHSNKTKEKELSCLAKCRDNLRKHPQLRFLFFELTKQCNLSCLHCASSCTPSKDQPKLTLQAISGVLQQVKRRYSTKKILVCLTGGEPLLHPEFFQIIQEIDKQGFSWGITTNAMLLSDHCADEMLSAHMGSISISLDGLEETHNALRRNSQAFQHAVLGIQRLVQRKMPVQITSVVTQKTIHELDAIYEIVQQLGAYSWRILNIEPVGRAEKNVNLFLRKEQYQELLTYIVKLRNESKLHVTYGCSHYLGIPWEGKVRDFNFICGSGLFVMSIMANGDIFPCLDMQQYKQLRQGNIFQDDVIDIWENQFQVFRTPREENCVECLGCEHVRFCAGVSAHTWDFAEQKPKLCLAKVLE